MALFSKLPTRKPGQPRADAHAREDGRPGARAGGTDAAAAKDGGRHGASTGPSTIGGITITGFGLVEPSPTRRVIEVTHANAGMCAVLENAVLLFASGHAEPARALLAEGIATDAETRASPLAWLVLFDLLQRVRDRPAFEQLEMQYVVQFERSAPAWDDRVRLAQGARPAQGQGGHVDMTGKLTGASAAKLESLRSAIAQNATQGRFDLGAITEFDDPGARLLADVLGDARRRQYPLRLQRSDRLQRALEAAVARGRDGGEGAWLLSLELLQWQNDRVVFDDLAVDYAVAFEVSPPSWEPSPTALADAAPDGDAGAAMAIAGETVAEVSAAAGEALAWSGVVAGAHPEQVTKLTVFAETRELVPLDMTEVERIDFVGAGAVYNAVQTIEERQKAVQIFGATPIVRAILLLIGLSPGHFFKKVA